MKRTARQIQGRPYVSPRTYFDQGSHEYKAKPFYYKIERLKEYVKSGYSLKRWIIEYRNYYDDGNHQHMRGYLEKALNNYIHYFKTNDVIPFYDDNPYSDNLLELISLLETEIKNTLIKEAGIIETESSSRKSRKFNEEKIRALINRYLNNRKEYEILSKELNIDFDKDLLNLLELRDKKENLEYRYSYNHLKSLLTQDFFYAMRENYFDNLFPQMGCSKNQLYYLKMFADKTKNKTNEYKIQVAYDIAVELVRIIYLGKKQKSID